MVYLLLHGEYSCEVLTRSNDDAAKLKRERERGGGRGEDGQTERTQSSKRNPDQCLVQREGGSVKKKTNQITCREGVADLSALVQEVLGPR